jgi:endonuclease/exonuclease/phosphatase family metal-dependent hydrolase
LKKLADKIILYSNILAAVLLLLSYTAPFINPSKLLFPAFLGLAYPFLLILNLAFILYWIIRFRKELLISLIVIILGWGHLMNLLPLNLPGNNSSEANPQETSMSILSYNVRTFDKYQWSENENSREEIFQLINNASPDILCIQEFYSVNRVGQRERDIRRKLKDYPQFSIYYSMKSSPEAGIGIATFSKYPIVRTSRIPFDNTMNQAIYTDVKIKTDTIRVFNIHLQSIKFGQSNYSFIDTLSLKYSDKRVEEVKDISHRLKDAFVMRAEQSKIIQNYISDSPYPVIVTGDFNDTPLSYSYNRIQKGLVDAFRESGRGLGNTYAGDLPSFRIDFILHSKELESTEFKRVKSKFSDHFPIWANLIWKEGKVKE